MRIDAPPAKRTFLAEFEHDASLLEGSQWLFVIKSQDQTIRRNRLISSLKNGKFGRTESRPTATGLLARVVLSGAESKLQWKKEFQEPRHVIRLEGDRFALTDVNSVNIIDANGDVLRRLTDDLYGFLHSIDLKEEGSGKLLVCSSGYDAVVETDLRSGQRSFLWSAWEHGFNPDEEGNWLALTRDYFEALQAQGKNAVFVDAAKYGEQGINTKYRSAHPNVAVYNPYEDLSTFIVSIGHGGTLYEVSLRDFSSRLVFDQLADMPHGLFPHEGGWVVTNTTRGEVWFLESDFTPSEIVSFEGVPGKMPELGKIEWLQNTKVTPEGVFLCLDANRGLIAFDVNRRKVNVYQPDPEWCFQDAIPL